MKLRVVRLGQTDVTAEGRQAIATYDALMGRLPLIENENVRGSILMWIGRTDIPGSPAERYKAVSDTISAGVPPDAIFTDRVERLKEIVGEFGTKVATAEEAYGTLSAANAAGSTPEGGRGGLILAGGVALLGLIVVPLVLD